MEALGDVAETADLIRYACDQMEANDGFVVEMGRDPLVGFRLDQYLHPAPLRRLAGDQPLQLPCALTGGPAGAALVAGNTVVLKPATDTPWTSRLIADACAMPACPTGCSTMSPARAHPWPGADRQPRSGRGHLYRLV